MAVTDFERGGVCDKHGTYIVCKESGKLAAPICPLDCQMEVVLAVEEDKILSKPETLPEDKIDIAIDAVCDIAHAQQFPMFDPNMPLDDSNISLDDPDATLDDSNIPLDDPNVFLDNPDMTLDSMAPTDIDITVEENTETLIDELVSSPVEEQAEEGSFGIQ